MFKFIRVCLVPVLSTTVALTIFTSLTNPAKADGNVNCVAYAQAAVAQQQKNLQLKCGKAGPRWSGNYAAHFNWCKRNNVHMADLTTQDRARKASLSSCKTNKKQKRTKRLKELECQVYAGKAKQLTAQRNKACNKKSQNASILDFRRYCAKIGLKAAKAKNAALRAQINSCKATPGCRSFAKAAVFKAKQNIQYGCNYTSSSFANNYAGHYQWCLKVGLATAKKARAETKAGITRCIKTRTKTIKPRITYTSYTYKKQYKLGYMVCTHPKGNSKRKCGLAAASAVCRLKGYRKAVSYKTYMVTRPNFMVSAYYLGTKSACKGRCKDFETITCLRK
jgi:hypothetical protein